MIGSFTFNPASVRPKGTFAFHNWIREAVAAHQFRFETAPINLTISGGLSSTIGDAAVTPTDLRNEADQKLYEAKRTGRNRVVS